MLNEQGPMKTVDIAEYLNLSVARTRVILSNMKEVVAEGNTTNRVYVIKK